LNLKYQTFINSHTKTGQGIFMIKCLSKYAVCHNESRPAITHIS